MANHKNVTYWPSQDLEPGRTLTEIAVEMEKGKQLHEVFGLSDAQVEEWYRFGKSLIEEKRYQDAADVLLLLSLIMPNHCNVWMAYGAACFYLKSWDSALQAYLQALPLDINRAEIFVRIAQCYAAKEDEESVNEYLNLMNQLIPENDENKGWLQLASKIGKEGR